MAVDPQVAPVIPLGTILPMTTNRDCEELKEQDLAAPAPLQPAATAAPPSTGEAASWRYAHLRKSNPAGELAPQTRTWLVRLPQHLRPINLLMQFPRIVNGVAAAWDNPAAFGELLTDLLYDFRGSRSGFSAEVVRELQGLRAHYYREPSRKR